MFRTGRGAASRPEPTDQEWGPWVEGAEQQQPGVREADSPAGDSVPPTSSAGVSSPAWPDPSWSHSAWLEPSSADSAWTGLAAPDQAAPDQAAPDQPAPDQPAPDQPAPDQPAPDQAAPDGTWIDATPTDPTPAHPGPAHGLGAWTDPTPTDPTPTDPTGPFPAGPHRAGRRRYRRQRSIVRRQADHWTERRWRREDRARAAAGGRRAASSTLLIAAAAVLAVVGVGLIATATAAQVHPPTPPPVSDPSPGQVVPVSGAPAVRPLPFFAAPGAAVPTAVGRTVPELWWGDLVPRPGLLPRGPTPGSQPAPGQSPEDLRVARALAAVPVSPPRTLRVPAIGVDSPVDDVGLTSDGEMEVPAPGPAYDHAAWYRYSVTPGRQGPSVIIGHIDSRESGPSVFFELGRLRPGDRVDVARADGVVVGFEVTDVRTVAKDAFPTEAVYGSTPRSELRLISCGGSFDSAARSYRDNIVVFAREVAPPEVRAAPPISVRPEPEPTIPPRAPALVPAHGWR